MIRLRPETVSLQDDQRGVYATFLNGHPIIDQYVYSLSHMDRHPDWDFRSPVNDSLYVLVPTCDDETSESYLTADEKRFTVEEVAFLLNRSAIVEVANKNDHIVYVTYFTDDRDRDIAWRQIQARYGFPLGTTKA